MNNTEINLQTNQHKELILLLVKSIRGGISSVKFDGFVKRVFRKKFLFIDRNNLYAWAMRTPLPFDEIDFDRNVNLEDIINTPHDSDNGSFVECH